MGLMGGVIKELKEVAGYHVNQRCGLSCLTARVIIFM